MISPREDNKSQCQKKQVNNINTASWFLRELFIIHGDKDDSTLIMEKQHEWTERSYISKRRHR